MTITLSQVSQVVNHVLGTSNFKDNFDYWLGLEIVSYGSSNYVSQKIVVSSFGSRVEIQKL